jgi:drug/metabolite transporter (DMT)-like permease
MSTVAIILVILSALMHAGRNYLTKKATDKQAFVWWYEVVGLLLFTPLFLVYFPAVSLTSITVWIFILASGLLHFVYWVFLTKALETGDLSLVYPIMRSSPALVLLLSILLLNEEVSPLGVAGILLVALGSYAINMQRLSYAELVRPLRALSRDISIRFACLTLASVAAYSIVDKVAVSIIHPVVFAYIYPWFSMLLFSGYLRRYKIKGEIKNEWRTNRKTILVCGFLSIFGYFLILVAFTLERVSYIVGLRQLSIVFAVLLGGYALKEKYKRVRFISASIIFMGTFLIAFG